MSSTSNLTTVRSNLFAEIIATRVGEQIKAAIPIQSTASPTALTCPYAAYSTTIHNVQNVREQASLIVSSNQKPKYRPSRLLKALIQKL